MAAATANAQAYSIVHSFGTLTNLTGIHPHAPLVRGPDGTLYGTTSEGEARLGVYGTVFKILPDGSHRRLPERSGIRAQEALMRGALLVPHAGDPGGGGG